MAPEKVINHLVPLLGMRRKPFYLSVKCLRIERSFTLLRAVLFDFFDTLATIRKGEVFYEPALRNLHESLTQNSINVRFDDFRRAYFRARDQLYADAWKNLSEPHFNVRVSLALKEFGCDCDASSSIISEAMAAFADVFMRYVELDAEAIPLLKELKSRYKLGVVSNFAMPECLRILIQKFELDAFFDVVVISADLGKRKPDPAIFVKALESLNVRAGESVFVGDTPKTDIKGARNIGMTSILLERERLVNDAEALLYVQGEDDTNTAPDYAVDHLLSVVDVLARC
jgi:HAD superfamily hydrolase (TIGR01549 family)